MTINIELDDELDNWLDRVSSNDGATKEEIVQNIIWDAYNQATKDV